jgi:hypothetical protein
MAPSAGSVKKVKKRTLRLPPPLLGSQRSEEGEVFVLGTRTLLDRVRPKKFKEWEKLPIFLLTLFTPHCRCYSYRRYSPIPKFYCASIFFTKKLYLVHCLISHSSEIRLCCKINFKNLTFSFSNQK